MSEKILRLKPDQVRQLLKRGEMEVVQTSSVNPEEPHMSDDPMIERAREVLSKDFLGVEAVRNMENKLKTVGVNVEFMLNNPPPFPYTEEDLQTAKNLGEMVVLRAANMKINGRDTPLTIIDYKEIFSRGNSMSGKEQPVFTFFHTAEADDWCKMEKFATRSGEIQLRWAMTKKEPLENSTQKDFDQQEKLLESYGKELKMNGAKHTEVHRRTAMEAIYDTMLYYFNLKKPLLEKLYDWTNSRMSDGYPVVVGGFNALELKATHWRSSSGHLGGANSSPGLTLVGVCPSR